MGAQTKNNKAFLLQRYGNKCFLCQKPMRKEEMTIEHIIPKARGGTNERANLRLAHRECNEARGSKPLYAFVKPKADDRSASDRLHTFKAVSKYSTYSKYST